MLATARRTMLEIQFSDSLERSQGSELQEDSGFIYCCVFGFGHGSREASLKCIIHPLHDLSRCLQIN